MSERKEVLPEQTVDGSNYVRALIDNHTFGKLSKQQDAMLSDYELGKSAGRVEGTMAALAQVEALQVRVAEQMTAPIDMVLHCPKCGEQHIDAAETDAKYAEKLHESSWWELGGDKPERWTNPPHRTHLCHSCGHKWRPADVATNGVAAVKTRGKDDDPIVMPKPSVPDWEAVKGKRMSELTTAQQDDAQELWMRTQIASFNTTSREHIEFLLRRLDEARGVK